MEEMEEIKKVLNPEFNLNKLKIGNKSVIMNENEYNLIRLAIKSRIGDFKGLKKLYQATIDGDRAEDFHSKCDNILNTLVLIKSAANRRFGGFTSLIWSSPHSDEKRDDSCAFLFSLDKNKIYPYKKNKKNNYATVSRYDRGPCFGNSDIDVWDCFIQGKNLFTGENKDYNSFEYDRDYHVFSQTHEKGDYVAELEVFEVIF